MLEPIVTYKMLRHYEKRTNKHIKCVQNNIKHLISKNPELEKLRERIPLHDLSKWEEPEYTPYIWLTWQYKCQDEGEEIQLPDGMEERIQQATWHHITTNSHHPEYWDPSANIDDSLNKQNRDSSPQKPVDATEMDVLSLAEMVCDWHAMGLERGNTTKTWADKTVNVRWLFTDNQVNYIYQWIKDLEDKTSFP